MKVLRCRTCHKGLCVIRPGADMESARFCYKCGIRGKWSTSLGRLTLVDTWKIWQLSDKELVMVNPGSRMEKIFRRFLTYA
jgi:hypothetical protein